MNTLDGITATAANGSPTGAAPALPSQLASEPTVAPATGSSNFLATVLGGLDSAQADSQRAAAALQSFALGEGIATHDVILAMEQARHSLQLAAEVRQRLSDAYKELAALQM